MDREELFAREERCQKAIRTVRRAVFMRLFVTAILLWAAVANPLEAWVRGLLALVMLMNLAGMLPLVAEWKKQKICLRELIGLEDV